MPTHADWNIDPAGQRGAPGKAGSTGPSGGGDLLSTLVNAESSITGTASPTTFDTLYVCTGTSANYTVTLPAVSGNAKKLMAFRGGDSTALTKVVTIDADGTEKIGSRSSIALLWDEQIILQCDGTRWNILSHVHAAWQSFTPSIKGASSDPTKATSHTDLAEWRRVGQFMEINELYYQAATTGAAAGSGTYKHTIPGGFAADTNAVKVGTGASVALMGSIVGNGFMLYSGLDAMGTVRMYDSTSYTIWAHNGAGILPHGSTFFSYTLAELEYSCYVRIPISGW